MHQTSMFLGTILRIVTATYSRQWKPILKSAENHVPTYEQPYYFLSDERKRDIKLEGDMLKRTGSYNENEIRTSILEGIP
jgi:hypothetical protein